MAESEDKGYSVKDRRYIHMSEEEKATRRQEQEAAPAPGEEKPEPAEEKPEPAPSAPQEEVLLPEINFSSFILSLSSSAFAALGEMPDPVSGKTQKNLPLAKQTIDLLGMLREKTRNNLTTQEDSFFDSILYDLRMRYVREVS
jgi:hypothetical protein